MHYYIHIYTYIHQQNQLKWCDYYCVLTGKGKSRTKDKITHSHVMAFAFSISKNHFVKYILNLRWSYRSSSGKWILPHEGNQFAQPLTTKRLQGYTQIEIARLFSYNGNSVLFQSSSKALQFISIDVPPLLLWGENVIFVPKNNDYLDYLEILDLLSWYVTTEQVGLDPV